MPRTNTTPKNSSRVEGLKPMSADAWEKRAEELAGKEREAQNLLQTAKIEGTLLKRDEQDVKNAALSDRVSHAESVRGVQAKTLAQKLQQEQNTLTFTSAETSEKQKAHDIALDAYKARNDFGTQMLATQKSMYSAKLKAAKADVENFIADTQAQARQLGGDIIDL